MIPLNMEPRILIMRRQTRIVCIDADRSVFSFSDMPGPFPVEDKVKQ